MSIEDEKKLQDAEKSVVEESEKQDVKEPESEQLPPLHWKRTGW